MASSLPDPPPLPVPPPPNAGEVSNTRPRFQFSLKTQLWFVTAIAVVLGIGASMPTIIVYILVSAVLAFAPAALTIGVVYGREDIRAFSIGGLFPAAIAMQNATLGSGSMARLINTPSSSIFGRPAFEGLMMIGFMLVMPLITIIASGFLCVWVRRFLLRRQSEPSE